MTLRIAPKNLQSTRPKGLRLTWESGYVHPCSFILHLSYVRFFNEWKCKKNGRFYFIVYYLYDISITNLIGEYSTLTVAVLFYFSTDVEEVTIDPNSQWKPVPVKQEPKDEECQGPQPKKARPSPPDSLPLSGVRTPTSQMSSGSGHYSPYQTQPPSNPGMGAPTPPGRTPPETHGSSGGGQLQEHNSSNSGTTQTATTPSGEWLDIVLGYAACMYEIW